MNYCKVFYNKDDNLKDIMRLVKEREPVNIEMKRYYSEKKLQDYFGYSRAYYGNCKKSKIGRNNQIGMNGTSLTNHWY